jgi:GNAT superfamily N-acetyltransferase
MTALTFIHDYKHFSKYRLSFNQLANSTFGIDFETWYQKGFWDERYICYSFLDGNQVVANVSINKMDVIMAGKRKRALHIGTVMTHPDYRKRGLSASLMNTVLDEHEQNYDLIYLFANKHALEFYPRFGFKPLSESKFSLDIDIGKSVVGNLKRLDASDRDDLNKIMNLAAERVPISSVFGVENARGILAWYVINVFPQDIYYLEDEDVIVICKNVADRLDIYDVISTREVRFYPLLNRIASSEIKHAVFHFTPNFADIHVQGTYFEPQDVLFVKSKSINFKQNFKYPITAQA